MILWVLVTAGKGYADTDRYPDERALEARCLGILRGALKEAQEFVKVHAAEALIWNGYPQGVREAFLPEENRAKPGYRIGVWRVLAQLVNADPAVRDGYVQKIRDVYLDPTSQDRLIAIESLGKVKDQKLLANYRRDGLESQGQLQVMARWAAANSGQAQDEAALAALLASSDKDVRVNVGYGLHFLPQIRPATTARLKAAARREKTASARVYLAAALYIHTTKSEKAKWRKELLDYLQKSDKDQKIEAAFGLSYGGDETVLSVLETNLSDPDLDVRISASQAILRILKKPVNWGCP